MDNAALKLQFYNDVLPARPNEWEVDEVFELLSEVDTAELKILLTHVGSIWPISHSLCFSYLSEGVRVMQQVPRRYLSEWVRQLISVYESRGLAGARFFIDDIEKNFLFPLEGASEVSFDDISGTMLHYIRGISGENIELQSGILPSTDTRNVILPHVINVFEKNRDNRVLYKTLVTLQWAHTASGAFSEVVATDGTVADLFIPFSDKRLAKDLFAILQLGRSFKYLEQELPGLVRQGRNLCLQLMHEIQPVGEAAEKCFELRRRAESALYCETLPPLITLYAEVAALQGSYVLGAAKLVLGEFDFIRAGGVIALRRQEQKKQFMAMLAAHLAETQLQDDATDGMNNMSEKLTETALMLLEEKQYSQEQKKQPGMHLDNEGVEIPEELHELIQSIKDDMGELPEAYVQAAAGMAGGGIHRNGGDDDAHEVSRDEGGACTYDEWDYRRGGYRNKWCTLYVKDLNPVVSTFVETTLVKYRPQLTRLRRQFEMLRTRDRFIRRRRHGDDIDLDAMIEALGDSRAGLCPSDRLFVRLLRDVRDISTFFLVDMSNSTEGWVGLAIKEALVLLAESLEVAGDSYGIYGFSGMRRSKSELFHVKGIEERYGTVVQQRIAAMMPQEYTRMGPPIRHLTNLLQQTQSKVRLLIVITDGKPEDYDDYKGQYAIEDTKKSLLEARGAGIHSFCITIDKSAHEYLAHMFGFGNYIFVDKVSSLPEKMSEMYRLLTS